MSTDPTAGTTRLCRSSYYTDTGRRQGHNDREVRCGLPEGHGGDHDEMIDGEPGNSWPRTAGTTGQAAQEGPLPHEKAVGAPAYAELQQALLAWHERGDELLAKLAEGERAVANLAAENARLRQERNEYREELHAARRKLVYPGPPVLAVDTPVLLVDGLTHPWRVASWDVLDDGFGGLVAVVRLAPMYLPSATETAPQTVPGVTGHTDVAAELHETLTLADRAVDATITPEHVERRLAEVTGHTEARPWRVLDDKGREVLRITAPRPGTWELPKVAEITSTMEPGGCTHITAVDADDAHGLAATLQRLAGPGHNDDCGSCCCCSIDTDRLRADLATLKQAAGMPDADTSLVADAIRGMLDNSRTLRTQIRPQLARAEADAKEARRELDRAEQNVRLLGEALARAGRERNEARIELDEARAETARVRHVYRDHNARLRAAVEALAERYERDARLVDTTQANNLHRVATELRRLPTTQPAANDAHIGSNTEPASSSPQPGSCDCDPLTGCPAGGHDA